MKSTSWFTRTNPILTHLRIVVASALVVAAAGMALFAAKTSTPVASSGSHPFVLPGKKGESDRKPGQNREAALGANEVRGADFSPDVEAYLQRAYPASEVPMKATIRAQNGFAALAASGTPAPGFGWKLIGPSKAIYPGVLNQLGDGASYIDSGRIEALAISPVCKPTSCKVFLAAAGGGIWRTLVGLSDSPAWEFVSGSFATNAMGSIIFDPNDSTHNTLLAGTGEPNASGDSEAGMGIYRSTDGGTTWTLLPGSAQFQGRAVASLDITPNGTILAGIARAVRGVSSVTGGSTSNPPGGVTFGVYKSTDGGATFTNVSGPLGGTQRGINQVMADPRRAIGTCFVGTTLVACADYIYYAAAFGTGVYRTINQGGAWTQIKTPQGASNAERSQFSVVTLPGNLARMYVGNGSQTGPAHFYSTQNNDAFSANNATFVDQTTPQNLDYCTGQCFYDNVVLSPAGFPDIVYLLGSFTYYQLGGPSNGRAVLLSTDGGLTWSDLTQDGKPRPARSEFTHPDQHAIVVNPNNPFQYWEGNDGGIIRSDGTFVDGTYKCDERSQSPANDAYCRNLLNRVPHLLTSLNNGLSTLQFQSLSAANFKVKGNSRGRSTLELQGGTQDNGTFQYLGLSDSWPQIIYGDGGQSGFSSATEAMRFNSFFGQNQDVNFRSGDPTKWCVATGPIAGSPESSYFYPPVIADPHVANGGTIFEGSQSVWRTQDWAGNQAYLEANCPEFTTSATDPNCGDFVRIGSPATDLTSAAYGDRAGACNIGIGCVAAIERNPSDTGTIWAATGTGRVFFSSNSNANPPNAVVWERLDLSSTVDPGRFPSSIFPDSADLNHAWISYSGYNFNTPAQPGHVFSVQRTGPSTATWTDITYNLPDFPITDLVHDDTNGDLYAASDFGVMRLRNGTTTWIIAGANLPMVEVAGLTLVQGEHKLFAATHGRSAWQLTLPGATP